MCGRINVHDSAGVQRLLEQLGIELYTQDLAPRYNIAPGAEVLAVFADHGAHIAAMEWGIVPSWAKEGQFTRPLINARAETLAEKPAFRHLIVSRRIIIPVNGFYEWRRQGGHKLPYYIRGRGMGAIALAGLYQVSRDGVMQCCVITTAANRMMAPIHQRMPAIIAQDNMGEWLEGDDRGRIDGLLAPPPDSCLEAIPVSEYVNNAHNEGERCITAVPDGA